MSRNEIIKLVVAVIIFAVVIAVVAVLGRIDTAQTLQLIITFVLVLVTVAYVKRTAEIADAARQQAVASVKMAEAAFRPIIKIDWIGPGPEANEGDTSAVFENIGVGPALNLQCYFTHPQFNFQYKNDVYIVMSIGEKRTISLHHENFNTGRAGLAINCDYQSIAGKHFRSILRFKTDEKRHFEIL